MVATLQAARASAKTLLVFRYGPNLEGSLRMGLIAGGLAVCIIWGPVLPRFAALSRRYPRRLASDPVMLSRFHTLNTRFGVAAGAAMIALGVFTIL
jgi:hypothetical protein